MTCLAMDLGVQLREDVSVDSEDRSQRRTSSVGELAHRLTTFCGRKCGEFVVERGALGPERLERGGQLFDIDTEALRELSDVLAAHLRVDLGHALHPHRLVRSTLAVLAVLAADHLQLCGRCGVGAGQHGASCERDRSGATDEGHRDGPAPRDA
jgi:hypothetical protein